MEKWDLGSSTFEEKFLSPLAANLALVEEKISVIEAARAAAEEHYKAAKTALKAKSSTGADLLEYIYAIVNIDKTFTTFKLNHADLVPPDGTDAFRLVQKKQGLVQAIQEELKNIKQGYEKTCADLVSTHKSLYRSNGGLKDKVLAEEAKTLARQAKQEQQKLPAPLELRVKGDKGKPLPLSAFIFAPISGLVEQASAFYAAFKGEFDRMHKDFSAIDASNSELSVKAYDPLSKDLTTPLSTAEDKEQYKTEYVHEAREKLVDDEGINSEDVDQGLLGDCYFLSDVASLAASNPEQIYGQADSIIQGPNADGTYTVRLYIPDEENQPKRVSIVVEPSFLVKKQTKKDAPVNEMPKRTTLLAQPSAKGEMWVQLLEKALAQLEGSYKEVEGDKKDINYRGIQLLTGKKVSYHDLDKGVDKALEELIQLYTTTNKVPNAQFGTKVEFKQKENLDAAPSKEDKPASGESYILYTENKQSKRLYANHAYTLKAIAKSEKGKEEFILWNPHNDEIGGGKEIMVNRYYLNEYFKSIVITP